METNGAKWKCTLKWSYEVDWYAKKGYSGFCVRQIISQNPVYLWRKWLQDSWHENYK